MSKQIPIVISIVLLLGVIGFGIWKVLQPDTETGSDQSQTKTTTQDQSNSADEPLAQTPEETKPPVTDTNCVRKEVTKEQLAAPYTAQPKFVILDVAKFGQVKVQLNYADAPKSSQNFAKLASLGFYNCLTFHRIIEGFVVQGGDPLGTGAGGPGYTIPAEIKLKHTKGSIAMARTGDEVNPKRDSSGSQFYISLKDLPQLDNQYTVFGQVVEGMDIVSKIGLVQTGPGDAPVEDVVITSATVSDK